MSANLDQVYDVLLKQTGEIGDLKADIQALKTKIDGNGLRRDVRNLWREVRRIWRWIRSHPSQCPFAERRATRVGRITVEIAAAVGILKALDLLGKWQGWW